MTDMNALIGKKYDKEKYHCWHFVEEVLDVPTLQDVHVDTANDDVDKYIGLFEEIKTPENNCIVLLGKSHIGVWFGYNIYHNDTHGVRCETERALRFRYPSFRYFKVKK